MHLVQKFVVEDVDKASSIMPAHIALVNPDGTPYTGSVAAHVDPNTGTVQQVIEALIAAGIMADTAEKSRVQAAATHTSVDEDQGTSSEKSDLNSDVSEIEENESNVGENNIDSDDAKPTIDSTAEEIRTYATEHGIDVPSKATKAEMLELIG